MKTILLLAALIMLAGSCKKEDINTSQFYGTWEIRSANFFPGPLTNYPAGNGNYIELHPQGTLNRYENTKITSSETFKIVKKDITACKWSTNNYVAIEYGSGSYEQIRINNDTLKISTPPCWEDGGTTIYVRINK